MRVQESHGFAPVVPQSSGLRLGKTRNVQNGFVL
jgi:hypothetical protein